MSIDTQYGFTKIVVDDIDRMAAFYQQVFGYANCVAFTKDPDGRLLELVQGLAAADTAR